VRTDKQDDDTKDHTKNDLLAVTCKRPGAVMNTANGKQMIVIYFMCISEVHDGYKNLSDAADKI
jgi:hypothetical protein